MCSRTMPKAHQCAVPTPNALTKKPTKLQIGPPKLKGVVLGMFTLYAQNWSESFFLDLHYFLFHLYRHIILFPRCGNKMRPRFPYPCLFWVSNYHYLSGCSDVQSIELTYGMYTCTLAPTGAVSTKRRQRHHPSPTDESRFC